MGGGKLKEREKEARGEDEFDLEVGYSPLAFEIVPSRAAGVGGGGVQARHRSHSRRAPPPELRKIRIKVHADDMRYVMAAPQVRYEELAELIRGKFGFGGGFRMKMKDEDGECFPCLFPTPSRYHEFFFSPHSHLTWCDLRDNG